MEKPWQNLKVLPQRICVTAAIWLKEILPVPVPFGIAANGIATIQLTRATSAVPLKLKPALSSIG